MKNSFKAKNQYDPEMKKRAGERNKLSKIDCSGIFSLMTASEWMAHPDPSQKMHEETLRKALVAGQPQSGLQDMLRL